MDNEARIQQFSQMAQADPQNELGHFSLGKAYMEAGRFTEAVAAFETVLSLNAKMSKGYQLLGDAFDGAGQRDRAIDVLARGITIADAQGDRMPCEAMMARLSEWGAPVPAITTKDASPVEAGSGSADAGFNCSRCGQPANQLAKSPFKGELGQKIQANVCSICWREWIGMGTKVINEMGLVLSQPESQRVYDDQMVEFLQLEGR